MSEESKDNGGFFLAIFGVGVMALGIFALALIEKRITEHTQKIEMLQFEIQLLKKCIRSDSFHRGQQIWLNLDRMLQLLEDKRGEHDRQGNRRRDTGDGGTKAPIAEV